jgi:hypothetical protein
VCRLYYPADSACNWSSDKGLVFMMRSSKNLVVFSIGLLGCLVGTYISLLEIIHKFSSDDPE